MMYFKTCEVCGLQSGRKLNEKRVFMSQFPLDEARCKKWVKMVGKSQLVNVPIEKLHMLKYVCGKHFKPKDFNKKKSRVRRSAVPSLLMNREPLTDDLLEAFPLHIAKENLTTTSKDSRYDSNNEHNYAKVVTSEREKLHRSDFIERKDTDANDSSPTILQTVAEQASCYVGRSRSFSRSPSNSRTFISEEDLLKEIKLEEQESYLLESELRVDNDRREGQRPGWDVQKSPVWDGYRSPIRNRYRSPERDNQRHISKSTIKRAIMNQTTNSDNFPVLNSILPDFDPCKKLSINAWLAKVEECTNIYRWNEQQTIHNALCKLCGQAKLWYEGLPSRKQSWIQWKALLTKTFSAKDNYADLLTEMLDKKVRIGESFELYFYSKIDLLNRCNIVGKKAVDCLIHGIENKSLRIEAEAAKFEKPEQVLQFFKTFKVRQKDFKSKIVKHRSSNNNNTFINRLNRKVCDQGQVYLWANWD